MLQRLRQRSSDERGFTLIELLVVILIIGILAAIAIPSFLNQKSKANDVSAKELARTAQTTAETYASDHNGSYEGLTQEEINKIETSVPLAAGSNQEAFLKTVTGSATGYEVTTEAPTTEDTFTITNTSGMITRTCSVPASSTNTGGCPSGSW
jgi:type IV pilus assembly protein PilA